MAYTPSPPTKEERGTMPLANQVLTIGQPLTYAWTTATDPDWREIRLEYSANWTGFGVIDSLAPSARSRSLTTDSIPADATNLRASVIGYLKGTFIGSADPASNMRVRTEPDPIDLVLDP